MNKPASPTSPLRCLSLFAGIGGFDVAAAQMGWQTVALCERDPFCQTVLRTHWPGRTLYDDITTLTTERLAADGCLPIDLIMGGPPCQPASLAGRRRGTTDARWLWPAFLRLCDEIRPRWVVAENPVGILSVNHGQAWADILATLASMGYRCGWGVWGAAAVGAPHRRERVFLLAHASRTPASTRRQEQPTAARLHDQPDASSACALAHADSDRWGQWTAQYFDQPVSDTTSNIGLAGSQESVAYTDEQRRSQRFVASLANAPRLCGRGNEQDDAGRPASGRGNAHHDDEAVAQSGMGRDAHGVPDGVDRRWPAAKGQSQAAWEPPRTTSECDPTRRKRLTALGNAVVPAQVLPLFEALAAWEAAQLPDAHEPFSTRTRQEQPP